MNSAIVDVYKRMYPQLSREVTGCKRLARRVEYKVAPFHTRLMNEHIDELSEEVFADGFERTRRLMAWEFKYLDGVGFGSALAELLNKVRSPKNFFKFYDSLDSKIRTSRNNVINSLTKANSSLVEGTMRLKNLADISVSVEKNVNAIFQRFFSVKTSSSAVKNIEKQIKEYGIGEVRLGNDFKNAQNVLKGVDIAAKNKDILPQKIFVSDYIERHNNTEAMTYFEGQDAFISLASPRLNRIAGDYRDAVIDELEKSKVYNEMSPFFQRITRQLFFVDSFSVDSPIGTIMHEIGHVNQPPKLPYRNFSQLNDKDALTATELTGYLTEKDLLSELFAEIYAKLRIKGSVKPDEFELFNRLCNGDKFPVPKEDGKSKITFKNLLNNCKQFFNFN